MKPIIFARIAYMKEYKGIHDNDQPENGGSYVKDTKQAHECWNFDVVTLEDNKNYCLGFSMSVGGSAMTFHIEKIVGCEALKKADSVDDVTVVFCAKPQNGKTTRIVGFYKHATVFREYQSCLFNDTGYVQEYNFIAEAKDCVLLPVSERKNGEWFVPMSGKMGYDFGFGHSNIWFAGSKTDNQREIDYVNRVLESIESYNGENWVEGMV